jgi:hypothetical protein
MGCHAGSTERIIAIIDMLVPTFDTKFDVNACQETSMGVATSADESSDGAPLVHTKYADDDAEDLDFDELRRLITRMGPAAPPLCLRTLESF